MLYPCHEGINLRLKKKKKKNICRVICYDGGALRTTETADRKTDCVRFRSLVGFISFRARFASVSQERWSSLKLNEKRVREEVLAINFDGPVLSLQ